jgi:RNA polymerase sigma-70 factor (ECF subfamily)
MEQTFETLLERINKGDESALADLLQQYGPAIRRAARRHLGPGLRPVIESLDLVQSLHHVLLVGMRDNRLAITDPASLMGLVRTLVRRRIARHWRKMKRQPQRKEVFPTDRPETRTDPVRELAASDEFGHFLARLGPVDRQLLELRWQGYTTAEAARALDLDPAFLRVRLQRLRKRLNQQPSLFSG